MMSALRSPRLFPYLLLLVVSLWGGLPSLQGAPQTTFVYEVVKDFGKTADLRSRLAAGDEIRKSETSGFGYIVRRVPVTGEAHLLRLMGVSDESRLSDSQKGLLESYRLGTSERLTALNAYAPQGDRTLTVNLVDLSACGEHEKFPAISNDFWPRASKYWSFSGDKSETQIDILISGVDSQGFGGRTSREMCYTLAHEFGHSLDSTNLEDQPYGPDGHHWNNEVIGQKAAYAEGFANFVSFLLYPERVRQFRNALYRVCTEEPEKGYSYFEPTDPKVKPLDLLRIEAVNALLLYRLATELPNGQEKVFAAFTESNSWENDISRYLKTLLRLHPGDASTVGRILDQETFGRLSHDEIRQVLGSSTEVELFLRTRQDAKAGGQTVVSTPPEPPPSSKQRIYKWKDKDGRLHFTDSPPPPGTEFTLMSPKRDPGVVIQGNGPFDGD